MGENGRFGLRVCRKSGFQGCLRADARELERLFGYTVSAEKATPSNEAFIFQMCEHIGLMAREEIL